MSPDANRSAPDNHVQSPASWTTSSPRIPRWVWVALMGLAAFIVAGAAGLLAYAGGANIPAAILTGGGAFAGAMLLLLAVAHYASGDRS